MNKFEALQILGLSGKVTKSDIKKAYQLKTKEFHPDRNPAGEEIMKMINLAYATVKDEDSIEVYANKAMNAYPEALSDALNTIINLGLDIEVCGSWVWVSGDTKAHKETLKSSKFRWAPKKAMWYFRPEKLRSQKRFANTKEEWSIEKIRDTFGTESLKGKFATPVLLGS